MVGRRSLPVLRGCLIPCWGFPPPPPSQFIILLLYYVISSFPPAHLRVRRSHVHGSSQGATGPRVLIACLLGVEAEKRPQNTSAHLIHRQVAHLCQPRSSIVLEPTPDRPRLHAGQPRLRRLKRAAVPGASVPSISNVAAHRVGIYARAFIFQTFHVLRERMPSLPPDRDILTTMVISGSMIKHHGC